MSNPVLEGWQRKQFKHLCEIVNGQVDPNEQPYCDMKHIGPGNVEKFTGRLSEVRTALEDGQISGKYLFTEEDVLYGKINPHFAKVAFPKYSGVCSADMYPVKCLSEISPGFLFQCLLSDSFTRYAESVSGRTGMPKINREDLDLAKFLIPPLPEQQKIASILTSVDDVIEKTEAQISKLQDLKQGMMQELLTKGIGHTEFKDSPVGRIPKSWDLNRLDELVKSAKPITYGIVQAGPHVEHGIPYIRVSDMARGFLSAAGMLRTSHEIAESYHRSKVSSGDLVYALRGMVGHALVIPEDLEGANLTQGTARISPGEGVTSDYILWALRSNYVANQTDKEMKGSTFQEITLASLRNIKLLIPSLREQKIISARLNSVDNVVVSKGKSLGKMQFLKKSLMQDLLTGKVRV